MLTLRKIKGLAKIEYVNLTNAKDGREEGRLVGLTHCKSRRKRVREREGVDGGQWMGNG